MTKPHSVVIGHSSDYAMQRTPWGKDPDNRILDSAETSWTLATDPHHLAHVIRHQEVMEGGGWESHEKWRGRKYYPKYKKYYPERGVLPQKAEGSHELWRTKVLFWYFKKIVEKIKTACLKLQIRCSLLFPCTIKSITFRRRAERYKTSISQLTVR